MATQTHSLLPDLLLETAASEGDETTLLQNYERVRADIDAVADEDLIALNLDVKACVASVLSALPAIVQHRDAIVAELPRFDVARFDKLSDYALALGHLQYEFERVEAPASHLPELYEKAIAYREALLVTGRALVAAGVITSGKFESSGGNAGYRNVGYELSGLARTLLEQWDVIAGRTAMTKEQLERAYKLGNRLVRASSTREPITQTVASATKQRLRGFTLLLRAYSDARRGIAAVRWFQGDADTIAPSLYAGRGGGNVASRKAKGQASAEPTVDAAPALVSAQEKAMPEASSTESSTEPARSRGDSLFTRPSDEPFVADAAAKV